MKAFAKRPLDLDPFAFRQFPSCKEAAHDYSGTKFYGISKHEFIQKVNEHYLKNDAITLKDGYAPFCKHLFIPNFTTALPGAIRLNENLLPYIRSKYEARRPGELPVLNRFVQLSVLESLGKTSESGIKLEPAKCLDIILYSKEQIAKESAAFPGEEQQVKSILPDLDAIDWPEAHRTPEYSVISIKAQDCDSELPMQPITIMRNAFIEQGGSGTPIDCEAYCRAVEYWDTHCELRS